MRELFGFEELMPDVQSEVLRNTRASNAYFRRVQVVMRKDLEKYIRMDSNLYNMMFSAFRAPSAIPDILCLEFVVVADKPKEVAEVLDALGVSPDVIRADVTKVEIGYKRFGRLHFVVDCAKGNVDEVRSLVQVAFFSFLNGLHEFISEMNYEYYQEPYILEYLYSLDGMFRADGKIVEG